MKNNVEFGEVKFFNPEKKFGFITAENGEEIFFHLGDGEVVFDDQDSDQPAWAGWNKKMTRIPQKADRVVFLRQSGKQGKYKACPWGFTDEYEAALKKIENREKQNPVGFYFRGGQYALVTRPGHTPSDWRLPPADISQFSRYPVIEGREEAVEEYRRRVELDRALLADYDFYLANPPRLELDAKGNGVVRYRDFTLEVREGRITKGDKSQDCPIPYDLGNWVWYDFMGGVDMEVLKHDAAIMELLQTNAVNPAIAFPPLGWGDEAAAKKMRSNKTTSLWRLVGSQMVYAYLTDPAVKLALEEIRCRVVQKIAEVGGVVAEKSCDIDRNYTLADEGDPGDGGLCFFAISFNSIGNDLNSSPDELEELRIRVKTVSSTIRSKENFPRWAEIAEPFRREISRVIGFDDYVEAWLEIYGK